jgi:hypothetical protein
MSGIGGVHDYNDMLPGSATGRDESAFYQAETQNLTRENQMLKMRIRELGGSCILSNHHHQRLTKTRRTSAI